MALFLPKPSASWMACLGRCRRFSSSSGSAALSRYGLGGQHWRQFNPESYQELIFQSLTKNVSYFEVAGPEGGDIAMVGAIQSALERNPDFLKSPVTITTRLGYRNLPSPEEEEETNPQRQSMAGDVVLTPPPDDDGSARSSNVAYDTPANVVHNLSAEYILDAVRSSSLLELQEDMENLRLVFLLHNPEVQVVDLLQEDPNADSQARQDFIQQRWTPAMKGLQDYANGTSNPGSISFGVCSNGLGIPKDDNHPMSLDTDLLLQAAADYNNFSTIELPANLLETYGWEMARKIKAGLPKSSLVDIVAMRPLTCYPDLGTSSGYPFRLVDYALPSLEDDTNDLLVTPSSLQGQTGLRYTNEMKGIPAIYQMTLQAAMSHFDAEELLEIKQERDLTMEERETLDGCKLMQSMIHDLDHQLEEIRSFAAHEDELYGRIIPLIHDTFELMDDTTSDVLQAYFAAYAVAVRFAIATKTRTVLREGETSASGSPSKVGKITYPSIPQTMTLQEYALRHMLSETCFDRVVVGASTMQDFDHTTRLMEAIDSGNDHPLEELFATGDSDNKDEHIKS